MLLRSLSAVFTLFCLLAPAHAQSDSGSSPSQQPGYTLQTTTRIVLTDVTVTDRNGNPVHGLKASDFSIFDNNKPQTLASFEEHTTTPDLSLPQAPTAPGVFSNDFLLHLPPVLNVIVIDTSNLEIVDQMYLYYELTRFLKNLPPGEPLAIYCHTGPASILLQGFTTDRALLLAAVHKAIPRFPPTGREYYSDFYTLEQIAVDLSQFPGRKNIIWFSGGSTLFLTPDPTAAVDLDAARAVYDVLESERIAIYPIDGRGLTLTTGYGMFAQHALMNDIAEATGGHAYYDNNGLDKITSHWLDDSGDYYTLTYSPSDFRFNNKWHKVRVKLYADGASYSLSYRHGYFADGSIDSTPQSHTGQLRTRLLAGGQTITEPDLRSVPLIFQARVEPASEATAAPLLPATQAHMKKGMIPFVIHYTVPGDEFTVVYGQGKPKIVFGVAIFASNSDGTTIARLGDKFTLTVNAKGDPVHISAKVPVSFDQQIGLRKGENYLYLAVWDMTSGRLGTLQIPFTVSKSKSK